MSNSYVLNLALESPMDPADHGALVVTGVTGGIVSSGCELTIKRAGREGPSVPFCFV